jgi:hypothetical protein
MCTSARPAERRWAACSRTACRASLSQYGSWPDTRGASVGWLPLRLGSCRLLVPRPLSPSAFRRDVPSRADRARAVRVLLLPVSDGLSAPSAGFAGATLGAKGAAPAGTSHGPARCPPWAQRGGHARGVRVERVLALGAEADLLLGREPGRAGQPGRGGGAAGQAGEAPSTRFWALEMSSTALDSASLRTESSKTAPSRATGAGHEPCLNRPGAWTAVLRTHTNR